MKTFLDRLGFAFHRPRFHGRVLTSIVCQGIYGGNKIVKYFDFVGNGLGFNTVKGSCLRTLHPLTEKAQHQIDKKLASQSKRYYEKLMKSAFSAPTMLKLIAFRMSRTSMKLMRRVSPRDYEYYSNKGWFGSEYYYPTRMGALTKAAGHLFDSIAVRIARSGKRQLAATDNSAA